MKNDEEFINARCGNNLFESGRNRMRAWKLVCACSCEQRASSSRNGVQLSREAGDVGHNLPQYQYHVPRPRLDQARSSFKTIFM
ncbi:hypothetical protein Mp_zg01390 [Marchantia polymorpha subsp. ruderalis]|uniref:Uncharacterized protein n=2 Tax=Marchantia polymorpha TaxID=3197 RepID=A0A679E1X0_MARPO|nr:hypothetical protein MARPO_0314s0001 [Marchantia polymorpha]BBN20784.1 hypothetical protein Mp_zg01390 [Marchantia polymorpha subsp. ruderalis]|eukprot:PTQ26847.1 hypothetical protein MARPO_0314s0001 [Marchantia polymorpha]